MSSRTGILALGLALAATQPAHAQQKLAYLIPTLFGPEGLTVDSEACAVSVDPSLAERRP